MTQRKEIARYGKRGALIRVFRETVRGKKYTRVQWRPAPKARLKTQSWEGHTNQAKLAAEAFAEGLAETLGKPAAVAVEVPAALTLDELFEKYAAAEFDHMAEMTRRNYRERWRKFVVFAGPSTLADSITLEKLDEFKMAMTKHGHTANQVSQHFKAIRRVFRWGSVERGIIAPSRVPSYRYKAGKGAKKIKMKEFRAEERAKVIAQFDPRDTRGWRPYVYTTLLSFFANRQTATRHLEWGDVDLPNGRIRWREDTAKTGVERWQPMAQRAIEALWVAYGWRLAGGYAGRFILFGVQQRRRTGDASERPWDYSAYMRALDKACKAADVPRAKYQGAHAFRRGVAGDLSDKFGSKKAADYIGDKSVRLVEDRYILTREEHLRDAAAALDELTPEHAPAPERAAKVDRVTQPKRNQRLKKERPGAMAEALTPDTEG